MYAEGPLFATAVGGDRVNALTPTEPPVAPVVGPERWFRDRAQFGGPAVSIINSRTVWFLVLGLLLGIVGALG